MPNLSERQSRQLSTFRRLFYLNRHIVLDARRKYVCPICGNVIQSTGEAVISCCGIVLAPLEAEREDDEHHLQIEKVEDEYYVSISHEMTKKHYISFIIAVKDDGYEIRKLYPEGNAEARFKIGRTRYLFYYCNVHGLFKVSVR